DKDFLNKPALEQVIGNAPRERLVMLALDAADVAASNADATGGEPIFKDGVGVGRVTSGAYGYSVGTSLALGYVSGAEPGDAVEVMVLGQPHRARILHEAPFDPKGARLRA
ncbi:MAG: glycine cleavage T C-terminal barrel domain-containing protein, partial [Roseovarius sp.]